MNKIHSVKSVECPICMELTSNPCIIHHTHDKNDMPHYFCQPCIIKWVNENSNPTCPNCRCDIISLNVIPRRYNPLLKYILKSGISFKLFPNKYQHDYNFVATALSINGLWLKYIKPEFRDNLQLALIAVSQNGRALEYVSQRLLLNKLVVTTAVKHCGVALRFAPHFKSDKTIAVFATRSHRWAFIYIDHVFFNFNGDKDILSALDYAITHDDGTLL